MTSGIGSSVERLLNSVWGSVGIGGMGSLIARLHNSELSSFTIGGSTTDVLQYLRIPVCNLDLSAAGGRTGTGGNISAAPGTDVNVSAASGGINSDVAAPGTGVNISAAPGTGVNVSNASGTAATSGTDPFLTRNKYCPKLVDSIGTGCLPLFRLA